MIVKTTKEIVDFWDNLALNGKSTIRYDVQRWVNIDSLKKELEKLRKKKRSMNYMFFLYEKALNDLESVLFGEATTDAQKDVGSEKCPSKQLVVAPKKDKRKVS